LTKFFKGRKSGEGRIYPAIAGENGQSMIKNNILATSLIRGSIPKTTIIQLQLQQSPG
jgi:hypothetical protein